MTKKRLLGFVGILFSVVLLLAACGGSNNNVAIGPAGSATNTISKLIFDAYELEEGDYNTFEEGFGDAAEGVQDGNINISVGILGLPASSIESLQASAGDVKMISLSDEAISYIEENSAYREMTIPADSYDFLEEDVKTVTAYAILMGNTNTISEELGYELAKAMIENSNEISHAQGAQMTLDNALNGLEDLPIHPGAARYYEEQGLEFDNLVAELNVADQPNELTLGTGSSGGTYYPLGGEMATVWNNNIDGINVTSTETGASLENLASIRDDKMDLGMSVHGPAIDAVKGQGDFDAPVENAAFIGHIYPEVVQIVTREEFGIDSFEDLK
ncbi:TAXI family TRAP transporter solute-binding subunit [Ornithinibacillus sp. L9]|uniref:TAXI family TRAP transporter solute-binding subunit n=1 Tax=Ornithinibacillus caprae TaxID=2678566 RepID=A0A6N8FK13_9BACI|nr:TAXI family TRAP transporter solute-binding subunit [Ornithinibacillus caprae]MUK89046.1 TAXI family TRAP transporter solute-binding subunit [Ornithinibacillus caprae]